VCCASVAMNLTDLALAVAFEFLAILKEEKLDAISSCLLKFHYNCGSRNSGFAWLLFAAVWVKAEKELEFTNGVRYEIFSLALQGLLHSFVN